VISLTFEYETEIQLENGSTAWIDNLQLVAPPDIQVTTAGQVLDRNESVDFGSTPVGQPLSRTFVIKNMGREPLTLASLTTVPAGFSIRQNVADTTLAAGQMTTFVLQLNAAAAGDFGGTVRLTSNDPNENPFAFNLSGTVTEPAHLLYFPLVRR
jgi:hypothetical protein